MLNRFLKTLGWFVLTLALQVLIFDHVHILGHATPFVAVYFVMLFNGESNRSEILLWSFAMGIIADTFTNTPGVATLSLTTLAMIQPWLLKFHSNTEDEDDVPVPSAAKMGWGPYMRYISVGVSPSSTPSTCCSTPWAAPCSPSLSSPPSRAYALVTSEPQRK